MRVPHAQHHPPLDGEGGSERHAELTSAMTRDARWGEGLEKHIKIRSWSFPPPLTPPHRGEGNVLRFHQIEVH